LIFHLHLICSFLLCGHLGTIGSGDDPDFTVLLLSVALRMEFQIHDTALTVLTSERSAAYFEILRETLDFPKWVTDDDLRL
jgi:hypothetical protein